MALGPRYQVPFRRRREGKTNYHKRLGLLRSERRRIVVRKGGNNVIIQLIDRGETGDITLVSASALELKKFGYKGSTGNTPAAYLAGVLFGTRALRNGFNEGVLDLGLNASSKGSRVYAALKGTLDSGFEIPHDDSPLPSPERITGERIALYARDNAIKFSRYGIDPAQLAEHVNMVKQNILELKNTQ
ncbi:MAG: 50S ribosomal protein L18 [Euryarchaeota archaeon]|nr:50S ribosomal protein L18 [Euryarchaeota archaeon]